MAQSGYTPVLLYYSGTTGVTPLASNLQNGELAINITDGKLFYKDNTNTVQLIAQKGGVGVSSFTAGTTGLTPNTATTGAVTLGGTLLPANGGTGQTTLQSAMNVLAGALTSGFYLRGNGTNVVMSAIQAADVPTLNQNTTGTAGNVTGVVALANGGSGQTTAQTAMNTFAGAVTSGQYLRGNGTNVVMSSIQAADVPTLNQNTTGNAAAATLAGNVTGIVAVANGGTGTATPGLTQGTNVTITGTWPNQTINSSAGTFQTSLAGLTPSTATSGAVTLAGTLGVASGGTGQTSSSAAFNALSPITTTGDLIIGNGTNSANRLGIGANTQVLTSNGATATWANVPVTVPSGSIGAIQFAAGSKFGSSPEFNFNNTQLVIFGIKIGPAGNNTSTIVGSSSLNSNTGLYNSAFGFFAANSNTSGVQNNAFGAFSLRYNVTGDRNNAFGHLTLTNSTTGTDNSAFGTLALNANISGSYNSAFGNQALVGVTSGSGNIAIGSTNSGGVYSPTFNVTTENNRIVMGSTSATNAYIQVGWTVVSDLRDKVVLGDVPHGLEFVKKLKSISYKFRASRDSDETVGTTKYGYGAQDILALEGDTPVVVDTEAPEKLKLTDQHLLPILSNAIRELAEQVEQLKSEIKTLKGN